MKCETNEILINIFEENSRQQKYNQRCEWNEWEKSTLCVCVCVGGGPTFNGHWQKLLALGDIVGFNNNNLSEAKSLQVFTFDAFRLA